MNCKIHTCANMTKQVCFLISYFELLFGLANKNKNNSEQNIDSFHYKHLLNILGETVWILDCCIYIFNGYIMYQ